MAQKRIVTRLFAGLFVISIVISGCGREELEATLLPPPTIITATAVAQPITQSTTTAAAPTMEATPTLASTVAATIIPTPLPEPTAVFGLQPLTNEMLPVPPQDLLFIGDGALQRWASGSGVFEILAPAKSNGPAAEPRTDTTALVGDVIDYDVDGSGRSLVYSRLTFSDPVTDTLPMHQFELVYLDIESGEERSILGQGVNLRDFAISDNGQYVLFIITDPANATLEREIQYVYLDDLNDVEPARQLAPCSEGCRAIVWHADNQIVVWGDLAAGLVMYNLDAAEPELLLTNRRVDPADTAVYAPISWAQNGRYLLLWQGEHEGGQRAVLDVSAKQVMPVPDSYIDNNPYDVVLDWMQDDRLFVLRPLLPDPPLAEILRVSPDEGRLVSEEKRVLEVGPSVPIAPIHLKNGRFAFGLLNNEAENGRGLMHLKGLGDNLERVNDLPLVESQSDIRLTWAPNGNVAVGEVRGQSFYAMNSNNALFDMRPLFGAVSRHFYWLPAGR